MAFIRALARASAIGAVAILGSASCDDTPSEPDPVTFVIEVSGETFRVRTQDPATIAALEQRRVGGTRGVISGELIAGDGGFNQPWNWHMDPATVEVPDVAIELCDGRPSMVEEDMEYWVGTVGRFCPWGALVVSRSD